MTGIWRGVNIGPCGRLRRPKIAKARNRQMKKSRNSKARRAARELENAAMRDYRADAPGGRELVSTCSFYGTGAQRTLNAGRAKSELGRETWAHLKVIASKHCPITVASAKIALTLWTIKVPLT